MEEQELWGKKKNKHITKGDMIANKPLDCT